MRSFPAMWADLFARPNPWIALGLGMLILALALLVLMLSRWGQVRPLYKCAALSIFAHILLAAAAYLTRWFDSTPTLTSMSPVHVHIEDAHHESTTEDPPVPEQPWQKIPWESPLEAPAMALERHPEAAEIAPPITLPVEPFRSASTPQVNQSVAEISHRLAGRAVPPQHMPTVPLRDTRVPVAEQLATAAAPSQLATSRETPSTEDPGDFATGDRDQWNRTNSQRDATATEPTSVGTPATGGGPAVYQHRFLPDRIDVVRRYGGSEATEAAVAQALAFLAAAQTSDGRWDASRWEAGREVHLDGQDREGAGLQADTGISALALLAFMAAGNTNHTGDYHVEVARGLRFLATQQSAEGDLSGNAGRFAAMYCHSMALLALAEGYALTGDAGWRDTVAKGVQYSIRAQHPQTGGWRYSPWSQRQGTPADESDFNRFGDMSLLGWQAMALYSARQAGVEVPASNWQAILRFVSSCSQGNYGGLVTYRPGYLRPPSPAMTAEAMFVRSLWKQTRDAQIREASEFLVAHRPGYGAADHYLWYYGTMALFQVQGPAWPLWNQALTHQLVGTQIHHGAHRGSWDPDAVWGQHGGRIYATALSTLSLEVYYRYLPMLR